MSQTATAQESAPKRTRGQQAATAKQLSRRIMVEIDRDMTAKTPKVIWEHELPILEVIFGEGRVQRIEPKTLDDGFSARRDPTLEVWNKNTDAPRKPSESVGLGFVFCGNPQAEYSRLVETYGKHTEQSLPNVEYVYGRFIGPNCEFANLVGQADLEDLPEEQLRSLLRDYGYLQAIDATSATDEQRKQYAEDVKRFESMSRDELIAAAIDVGVQIG